MSPWPHDLSLLLTTLASSDMPLSTGHEPFCIFLSPKPNHIFAHHNGAWPPETKRVGRGFLLSTQGKQSEAGTWVSLTSSALHFLNHSATVTFIWKHPLIYIYRNHWYIKTWYICCFNCFIVSFNSFLFLIFKVHIHDYVL